MFLEGYIVKRRSDWDRRFHQSSKIVSNRIGSHSHFRLYGGQAHGDACGHQDPGSEDNVLVERDNKGFTSRARCEKTEDAMHTDTRQKKKPCKSIGQQTRRRSLSTLVAQCIISC